MQKRYIFLLLPILVLCYAIYHDSMVKPSISVPHALLSISIQNTPTVDDPCKHGYPGSGVWYCERSDRLIRLQTITYPDTTSSINICALGARINQSIELMIIWTTIGNRSVIRSVPEFPDAFIFQPTSSKSCLYYYQKVTYPNETAPAIPNSDLHAWVLDVRRTTPIPSATQTPTATYTATPTSTTAPTNTASPTNSPTATPAPLVSWRVYVPLVLR